MEDTSSVPAERLQVALEGVSTTFDRHVLSVTNALSEVEDTPDDPLSFSRPSVTGGGSRGQDFASATALSSARNTSNVLPQATLLNRYEALIRAGKESIIDDPLLLPTPYIVNTKHKCLICVDCKHGVDPQSALTHVHQLHQHCRPPRTLVTQLGRSHPGLRREKIVPDDNQPVFGLAVPADKYVVCARYRHGYVNVASWRNHSCEKSEADLNGGPPHFMSHVQTFFRGTRICYFPIRTPSAEEDDVVADNFERFKIQYLNVDAGADDEGIEVEDYRKLNQFLSKEGWLSHIAGHSLSDISALVSLPGRDDMLSPLANEVFKLMSNIQSIIGKAGYHVRRLLGRRPS